MVSREKSHGKTKDKSGRKGKADNKAAGVKNDFSRKDYEFEEEKRMVTGGAGREVEHLQAVRI